VQALRYLFVIYIPLRDIRYATKDPVAHCAIFKRNPIKQAPQRRSVPG
jgi:hypothetical protein